MFDKIQLNCTVDFIRFPTIPQATIFLFFKRILLPHVDNLL